MCCGSFSVYSAILRVVASSRTHAHTESHLANGASALNSDAKLGRSLELAKSRRNFFEGEEGARGVKGAKGGVKNERALPAPRKGGATIEALIPGALGKGARPDGANPRADAERVGLAAGHRACLRRAAASRFARCRET